MGLSDVSSASLAPSLNEIMERLTTFLKVICILGCMYDLKKLFEFISTLLF